MLVVCSALLLLLPLQLHRGRPGCTCCSCCSLNVSLDKNSKYLWRCQGKVFWWQSMNMKTCRNNLQGHVKKKSHLSPLPRPYPLLPAPSTVTQRTAVGTKLCDMCISGAPRCVCVMWTRGEANFKIYAQVAGQLTNKHINQFIDGARDESTHAHPLRLCVFVSVCVCLCVCVCVFVSVFCHSFRAQLLSFASTTKANLIKLFVHA